MTFRVAGGLLCALNVTDEPIELPEGEVLIASGPLLDGMLPRDAAVWLVP